MTDIHVTTMSFEDALTELKRQEALREAVANDARELELDELETQPTLHMPSRDFLVRQACLNTAVQEHVHCMNGAIAKQYLNARTFGGATATPQFVAAVCAQFRKLVAAYQ